MKPNNLKKEALIWMALIAPFVCAIFVWNKLPDQIPTHWNMKGEPDDYSGKAFGLLLFPGVSVMMYFILLFIPRIDPRKKNYDLFGSSYQNIRMLIHLFMVAMFFFIMQATFNPNHDLNSKVIIVPLCLFFALLGNYMRTIRSNFFVGIRTPWTLSSDVVWKKTHELGGRIWFYSGLALAALGLLLPESIALVVMIAGISGMAITPVIYSYFEYQKVVKSSQP